MDTTATKRRWVAVGDNVSSFVVIGIFGILIINCLFIDKGYYDTMATDLLGFLDGIYRTHLGQITHRDFSTAEGAIQFMLPAFFVNLGAGLLSSINYYHVSLLVLALCIVIYIQRTRLDNLVSIFLGGLVALALACKYNFGDDPFQVTEAMFYNRIGYTFLMLELILFIPPRVNKERLLVVDGLVVGLICGLLFYVKISFGLVALAFAFLHLLADGVRFPSKVKSICASIAVFLLFVAVIELAFGGRFAWYRDLSMAMAANAGANLRQHLLVHKLVLNAPEIAIGVIAPFVILRFSQTKTKAYWWIYALAITVASFVLQLFSAQDSVLLLPVAFVLFAMSKLDGEIGNQYLKAMTLLAVVYIAILAYPMMINIAFASESSRHPGNRLASANSVVNSIYTRQPDPNVPGVLTSPDMVAMVEKASTLDKYMLARRSRPANHFEELSFPEVRFYLNDGLRAANAGCPKEARIGTLDFVNPFPALLGWPVGGGMIFAAEDYLMSRKHHLSGDEMFRQIDCILVPKMQLALGARELLTDIYGPYLEAHYVKSAETELWNVLKAKTDESKAEN